MITTPEKYRRRVKTVNKLPSLTEQCHGDECKIDNIVKKYRETGVIDRINSKKPQYMDMTGSKTLHEAYNIMADAKTAFMELPAKVRKDFDNDPGLFVDFMQNPENKTQIEEYGFDSSYLPEPAVHTQGSQEAPDEPPLSREAPTPPETQNAS